MKTLDEINMDRPMRLAKSLAEEWTLRWLECLGITWEYEPSALKLPTGEMYVPDIYLPELGTYVECKGELGTDVLSGVRGSARNLHKPKLLALELARLGEESRYLEVFVLHSELGLLHLAEDGHCVPLATVGQWADWCDNSRWVRCASCSVWQPWIRCSDGLCRVCSDTGGIFTQAIHHEDMMSWVRL